MSSLTMNLFCLLVTHLYLWSAVNAECGYTACPKTVANKLNIHIISHSHDDVGWLSTADGYYMDSVHDVITNVVKSLKANANRRFTQVELYYFNRWWNEQTEDTRTSVRTLVNNGQLVFSNGGWTVNDEGAAHYDNIIDQMTLGLKVLDELFGSCGHPKVSWQIDPFGASKEMASLYAHMGFDGHFTNRGIHPQGEFLWRGSHDLGMNSDIFQSNLHNHYAAPNGFNFEDGRNNITDANKASKATEFVKVAQSHNTQYGNTNHVLMPMGDDFQYRNAENWFSNIDKLIKEITATHTDVNIFYSTPNCYIYSLNNLNKTWTTRDNDYFNLWTGYYTSRPALKREDRYSNNYLQASKQLDVLSRVNTVTTSAYLDESRNEVAVMTHHDAITGTSPQKTADDYVQRLYSGWDASRTVIQKAYKTVLPKTTDHNAPTQVFCDTLNMTACSITESSANIAVTIYNPIARPVSQWLRIPVGSGSYDVYDQNQEKLTSTHLVPVAKSVTSLPGRKSSATNELVFKANLPALGFVTYLMKKSNALVKKRSVNSRRKRAATIELKGKSFSVMVDDQTGELSSVTVNGKTHSLHQSFKYYKSAYGQNVDESGTYNFCPDGINAVNTVSNAKLLSKFSSGQLHEVTQQWSDWVSQTIRTYEDEEYIEFDWVVGPIPVADNIGKEVITRFESDLKNDKVFYTDANGRQMVKRIRDPNTKGCNNNNVTANWYPIYSKIFIRDETQALQMTVLNDRTQGGSSIIDGSVEMMVHRRLLHKEFDQKWLDELGADGKGLVVRGKHYLFFKSINESAKLHRDLSQRLYMEPILTFSSYTTNDTDFRSKWTNTYSFLNRNLPENVHLLTLENWKKNQVLLRLEHFYETADNNDLSKAVDVNLDNLFKNIKISSISETTLGANEVLSQSKRLHWNNEVFAPSVATNLSIHLIPQQIRTFILTVEDNLQPFSEKCTVSWKNVTNNEMPSDAVVAGFDIDKSALYICRHTYNNDLLPGKASHGLGCHVTWAGGELELKSDYEVLVGSNVDWVPRHGGDPLPHNAFVAGKTSANVPLYVGRCYLHATNYDTLIPGKVHYWFYYGFGNTEHSDCGNHQVLVCNSS